MPGTTNPLQFLGESLAAADGDKFTPEKFITMLDELFAAAKKSPNLTLIVVARHNGNVGMLGVAGSESISGKTGFLEALEPVMTALQK